LIDAGLFGVGVGNSGSGSGSSSGGSTVKLTDDERKLELATEFRARTRIRERRRQLLFEGKTSVDVPLPAFFDEMPHMDKSRADNGTASDGNEDIKTKLMFRGTAAASAESVSQSERDLQDRMASEMVDLSAQLKQKVTDIQAHLRRDTQVLDGVDTAVDENRHRIVTETNRLRVFASSSCTDTVMLIAILVIAVVIFFGTIFIMKFVKKARPLS